MIMLTLPIQQRISRVRTCCEYFGIKAKRMHLNTMLDRLEWEYKVNLTLSGVDRLYLLNTLIDN